MNAWCLHCLTGVGVRSTRGSRIEGLRCDCGQPLVGSGNGVAASIVATRRGDLAARVAVEAAKAGDPEPARLFGLLDSASRRCWGRFIQALADRDFDEGHHLHDQCDRPLTVLLLVWAERGARARPTHATVVRMETTCREHATIAMRRLFDDPHTGAGRVVAVTAWPMSTVALARIQGQPVALPELLGGSPLTDPGAEPLPAPLIRMRPAPVALKLRRTSDRDVQEVELHGRRYQLHTFRDGRGRGRLSYAVVDVTDPDLDWTPPSPLFRTNPDTWRRQLRAEGSLVECRGWLEAVARGENPPPHLDKGL